MTMQERSRFETRSGRIVKVGEDGTLVFDHVNGYLNPESAMDAEEYFQAKRDAELGRWRWLENPVYVMTPDVSPGMRGRMVRVLNERAGTVTSHYEHDNWQDRGIRGAAAFAYFEAHPERSPWDGMQVGEIWMVTLHNVEQPCRVVTSSHSGLAFLPLTHHAATWFTPSPAVTDAHRIWPAS